MHNQDALLGVECHRAEEQQCWKPPHRFDLVYCSVGRSTRPTTTLCERYLASLFEDSVRPFWTCLCAPLILAFGLLHPLSAVLVYRMLPDLGGHPKTGH